MFKLIQFKKRLKGEDWTTDEGMTSDLFPGIVLHLTFDEMMGETGDRTLWRLSHIPTGYGFPGPSLVLSEALNAAVEFGTVADWSKLQTEPEVQAFISDQTSRLKGIAEQAIQRSQAEVRRQEGWPSEREEDL